MTYSYRAYGLTLSSDTPISALQEKRGPFGQSDVVMHFGEQPLWAQNALRLPFRVERPRARAAEGGDSPFTLKTFSDGDFFELSYGDGTRFLVDRAATRIWGTCQHPLTREDLETYLLGPILGFALRRRGVTALHASSVLLFDTAVVLCGPSESGKSTTAAALALRGAPVLAEDISAVVEKQGWLHVEPGYPRVCLWPDAVQHLLPGPDALPRLTPTWDKCYLPLDGVKARFAAQRQPAGVIYVFAPRSDSEDAPRIEEPGAADALFQLVQNTYMNWLLDRNQRAAELDMLTRLVSNVPVRRIVPHADLGRIGALCDLIMRHSERFLGSPTMAAECHP